MSRRLHVVRSAVSSPVQEDRRPVQRGRRRGGLTCVEIADKLAEAAGIYWADKYAASYGALLSLVGSGSAKPVERRIGLMVVCLAVILINTAPPGARWDVDLTTTANGQPVRLVMHRDDVRHAVPVRLDARTLKVGGQEPVTLTTRDAGTKSMRAFAAEIAAFFGAPVRSTESA